MRALPKGVVWPVARVVLVLVAMWVAVFTLPGCTVRTCGSMGGAWYGLEPDPWGRRAACAYVSQCGPQRCCCYDAQGVSWGSVSCAN